MKRPAIAIVIAALSGLIVGVAGLGWINARADPVVRRATIALPGWPHRARPVRVALLSDLHI